MQQDGRNTWVQVYQSIDKELILDQVNDYNEEEIIRAVILRVEYLLNNDKDLLMSFLYRLDIPHEKVQAALRITHEVPVHVSLGLLIYYRQLERVRTKLKYKQPDLGEEWNTWH